jgi:hypothetical protein
VSKTQRGVAAGMAAALAVTLAITFWCVQDSPGLVLPFHMVGVSQRWTVAAACWLGPLVALVAAIGAVANRRFFSPDDIDGAGLTPEGPRLRVPRAILANTLEQAVLAIPVYTALALFLPARQLPLPVLLSAAFVIGRIAFAAGYARGAAARSFGFALTFYPTMAGLLVVALVLARRIAG